MLVQAVSYASQMNVRRVGNAGQRNSCRSQTERIIHP